jgi:hypothetical protein
VYNAAMANEDDVRGTKYARSELARRGIDSTQADIRVMHGICYIRGSLRALRSANIPDLRSEMEKIAKILRTKAEIKDVVIDAIYRS